MNKRNKNFDIIIKHFKGTLIYVYKLFCMKCLRAISLHTKILHDNRAKVYINEKYIKS